MAGQLDLALSAKRTVPALTVTRLVRMVREALEARFDDCWVVGEISNARRAPSNHLYFTLKDAAAALSVVMFSPATKRLRFKPADGMQVIVRGRVNVYETRGALQFYAEEMEPRGAGALQAAFEQLKKRLAAEGLFDSAHKRPLPFLPRAAGIVTALRGAGLQDMLRVLFERFPNLHVIIRPARVQGEGAAGEIAAAVEDLNRDGRAQVIIVGRGGGSLEDLQAFNDETVARAIYRSRLPVISAVGHEIDFTIADFAADHRAPTPTFAAQMAVPCKAELSGKIGALERALAGAMRRATAHAVSGVARLAARIRHPRSLLQNAHQRLDEAGAELARAMRQGIRDSRGALRELKLGLRPPAAAAREARLRARELGRTLAQAMGARAREMRGRVDGDRGALVRSAAAALNERRRRLGSLATRLDSLSPLKCLERGYAIVADARDGRAVLDARTVEIGDRLEIRLSRGRLRARTEGREI